MRLASLIIAIILLPPSAMSQDAGALGSQPLVKSDQLCTVEGSVMNSVTGEPVKKVMVTLTSFGGRRSMRQLSSTTDVNGHFVIGEIEPGSYSLQAGGGGFPSQIYGQQIHAYRPEVISLVAGQNKKDIVFKIAPGAVIAGAVYDEEGDPVIGANVQAYTTGGAARHGGRGGSAQTNDRGEYRIYGLDSGKYLLMAATRGPNEGGDELYLPTFYPGTSDEAQASPVEVHPGDELAAINMIMTRTRGVRVRGRVIIEGAQMPNGIYVNLSPQTTEKGFSRYFRNYGAQVLDESGDFEIVGVPPGAYIAFSSGGDAKTRFAGRAPVDVSNVDVDNVAIVLKSPAALHGRVRTESGARMNFSQLRIWLQPADNQMMGGEPAEVAADGTFVIRNLYDGNYGIVVAGHTEEFYVKSERLGGSDVLGSGLSLGGTELTGMLEIELSGNGGAVSGTAMHDQAPASGAIIALVPEPPNRKRDDLYDVKFTDQSGKFNMTGLAPGDYKLFAWDSSVGVDPHDPDSLKAYEDKGQSVHVEEKRQQAVQLELISSTEAPE
ncbi:MAG TPA: carboxypeptidase-like regulatory domain-containing protein [Terriglobia bacterium]|nr:carboxypeptidase-like regulatory domain-containing protein [Terriglobia bacterium]